MSPLLRALRRKPHLDFSDYLELRHQRDAGDRSPEVSAALAWLESRLPVRFAHALPDLHTGAPAATAPPRGLSAEAVQVMFQMREEFAVHGRARRTMMGFDLPDGEGLKDWLDFIENERRHAMSARHALRELDRRIWAVYTGERKMPLAPPFDT